MLDFIVGIFCVFVMGFLFGFLEIPMGKGKLLFVLFCLQGIIFLIARVMRDYETTGSGFDEMRL